MRSNDHILGGGRFLCHRCGYVREADQEPEHRQANPVCAPCVFRHRNQWEPWARQRQSETDYMARVVSDAEIEAEAEAEANRQSAILADLRRRWESEPLPEWPSA